jgi:hypothetical protein
VNRAPNGAASGAGAQPSGFEQSINDFDVNGHGYLYIKIIPNESGPPQFDPSFRRLAP